MLPSFHLSRTREWTEDVGNSSEQLSDLITDPDAAPMEVTLQRRFLSWRFVGYFAGCLLVTLTWASAAVALWSNMGCGTTCINHLRQQGDYFWYCVAVVVLLGLVLYMLDFFLPPHMPGRYLEFTEGGKSPGRAFAAVAGAATLAGCFLSAKYMPTLPLVVTITLAPLSLILLRRVTMPDLPERPKDGAQGKALTDRIVLLKLLSWEERDEKNFYSAATYAFLLSGLLCLVAWIPWAAQHEPQYERQVSRTNESGRRELLFIRWASPLVVAFAQFIFAGFACLRVTLNRAYSATDEIRNQLILDAKAATNRELSQYRIATLRARLAASHNPRDLMTTEDRLQQYFVQHISHMRQLSNVVKSVLITFLVLAGVLHIVFLVSSASHTAVLVQSMMGSFLMTFLAFICVSFNRLSQSMSMSLMDLPPWKSVQNTCQADWARALAVSICLPLIPFALLLSVANNGVRHCRGLGQSGTVLTPRVRSALDGALAWNWVSVTYSIYVWAAVLMLYRATPVALNVLLAWMTSAMDGLNFGMILACTFFSGVVLFMLPPVPGPAIYPFAGIMISQSCPWGFWWGCVICIVLCFFLKLTACAVQQKLIGEMMGNNLAVRRVCGVHKPFMRAIEGVLHRPGLSFGKVMILCGGPDWPTSVVAGILRLSLFQCLLGTVPIIATIIPLALTGSFYLKREEGEVWLRCTNLMLTLTALVSAFFWVGIGWAVQAEYDRCGDDLTRPKEQYLELEWLDHRAAFLAGRCKTVWDDLPCALGALYLAGAVCATLVGHAFLWRSSNCFGSFSITDGFADLRWFGVKGIIRPSGVVMCAAGVSSFAGLIAYQCWNKRRSRTAMAEASKELEGAEAAWKEQWLARLRSCRLPYLCSKPSRPCLDDIIIINDNSSEVLSPTRQGSSPMVMRQASSPAMPRRTKSRVLLGVEASEELKVYGRAGSMAPKTGLGADSAPAEVQQAEVSATEQRTEPVPEDVREALQKQRVVLAEAEAVVEV